MRPENSNSPARTELRDMVVRLVHSSEQPRYQELMREHHYLGHLPKMEKRFGTRRAGGSNGSRELFGLGTAVRRTRSLVGHSQCVDLALTLA